MLFDAKNTLTTSNVAVVTASKSGHENGLEIGPRRGDTHWATATKFCYNKGEGWRLPTLDETYVLYLAGASGGAWHWTSTRSTSQRHTWTFIPNRGHVGDDIFNNGGHEASVICVRTRFL